ncbi:MAG: biotin--[acetyl-CoA-carboxylase] ligase [Ruminococcaceae bacterium]|nr:biotin--[acetyl-CoA-carboxylase] ligase [Oscillospiraceae bacterium]
MNKQEKIRISEFVSLDSTNKEARRQAEMGLSVPALIVAEGQSEGRGRMGRSFFSPEGSGLYMSLLLRASENIADNLRLTTIAAVGTAQAIFETFGIEVGIKWVNDLYYREKKVCGILCESFVAKGVRYSVIGVGVNLSTEEFPREISEIATSLGVSSDKKISLARVISEKILELSEDPSRREIIEYYRDHSIVLGKEIIFFEGHRATSGRAVDIDELGGLVVLLDDGSTKKLSSGEISLRFKE